MIPMCMCSKRKGFFFLKKNSKGHATKIRGNSVSWEVKKNLYRAKVMTLI